MNLFTCSKKLSLIACFAVFSSTIAEADTGTSYKPYAFPLTCANPPAGLTAFDIAPTSAKLAWTSVAAIGYEVEYGLSGFTQGTGTTVNSLSDTLELTGLLPQTAYGFFVRAFCVADTSTWSGPVTFTTTCPPVTIPYLEDFSPSSTAVTCWSFDNPLWSISATPSAFGTGTGSAFYDFFNSPLSSRHNLNSPVFPVLTSPHRLQFDHAYRTRTNQIDSLIVFYSTNGGITWIRRAALAGGLNGALVTQPPSSSAFVAGAGDWTTKQYNLPAGVDRVRFQVFSANGNNLYIDNVRILPLAFCPAPTGLQISNVTSNAGTVKWVSAISNSAVEYGLRGFQLGTGSIVYPSGIDTARLQGLQAAREYDVYVRSICGAFDSSAWTGPIRFSTGGCTNVNLPLNETWSLTSNTRACWIRSSSLWDNYALPSANGVGEGSAGFDFFNTPSSNTKYNLTSPRINLVTNVLELKFSHAYATKTSEVDTLRILYSRDSGATWVPLVVLLGGASGSLTTAPPTAVQFVPTSTQWANKSYNLPRGTNTVRFEAVSNNGNMMYIDNIEIITKPACIEPTSFSATNIDFTSATINWSSAPSYVEVQYGLGGFTLGTGTIVGLNNVNTYNLTGLSIGTIYNVYLRRACGQFDTSIWNGPITFSTLCPVISSLPWEMNFDSLVTVPNLPFCFRSENIGSSPWTTRGSTGSLAIQANSLPNQIISLADINNNKDNWFYLPPMTLDSADYQIEFYVRAPGFQNRPERLRIRFATSIADITAPDSLGLYTEVYTDSSLFSLNWSYRKVQMSPTATNVYYIGFNAFSEANGDYIAIDDIKVDIFVTGLKESNTRKGFSLYPNPTTGEVNIRMESASSDVLIGVTDITGNLIRTLELKNESGLLQSSFDLSDLPKGMYLVTVKDKEGSLMRKVILD